MSPRPSFAVCVLREGFYHATQHMNAVQQANMGLAPPIPPLAVPPSPPERPKLALVQGGGRPDMPAAANVERPKLALHQGGKQ